MNYWKELVEDALLDAGVSGVTDEQLELIASTIEGGYENHSLCTGRECIPDPRDEELSSLRAKLKIEREKVICTECNGSGNNISHGPAHSAINTCWKCHGDGRRAR